MVKQTTVRLLAFLSLLTALAELSWSNEPFFRPVQTYYPGGYAAISVALGDVNDDGRPDLISAVLCLEGNCDHGGVGVLLGNGDGTFQPVRTFDSGGVKAVSIAIGDVNRDDRLDLLVANECAASNDCRSVAAVLLGNGDGTFKPAQTFATGGYSASMSTTADVNTDGNLDLVVANICPSAENCDEGIIGVILGNGDGTFQPVQRYRSGDYAAISIAVGDVNLDHKPDLLVSNYCGRTCRGASVLLGNGDGTFQQAQKYPSGGFFASSIAAQDLNGDAKLDLIVANNYVSNYSRDRGTLGILLGSGDGTFELAHTYNSGGFQPDALALGDVNGDGRPDLVTANYCAQIKCVGGGVAIRFGNGNGTFEPAQRYPSGGDAAISVVVDDLNGDGKADVLVGNQAIGIGVLLTRYITTTNLQSSVNTSTYGQPLTLTATLASDGPSSPVGTVTFRNGSRWLGQGTLVNGIAVLTTRKLPAGTASLTATYSGDAKSVKSKSAALPHTVNTAASTTTLLSSASPSVIGQPVTFTAGVTSPTSRVSGIVTFSAGNVVLGTASLTWSGKADLTTTVLPRGRHTITAIYSGTTNINSSTDSIAQTVN